MLRANLNDIQVFMAVVDAGSFVAGGQTMGLSRSAAGKAIARLEQRLSVRLLHRTTRSLGLTDEGRVLSTWPADPRFGRRCRGQRGRRQGHRTRSAAVDRPFRLRQTDPVAAGAEISRRLA